MYRKFRNVLIFKDFPPISPYFLGLRVGKVCLRVEGKLDMVWKWNYDMY